MLFVGRFVPEKAPDALVRAFHAVAGDHRLVLVGESSFTDAFTAELRSVANEDPRVMFTGYAGGMTLEELYSNAAAFVLPSTLEGMPLTLLEAIAHGTPVIASDIPPHREVLKQDGPGRRLVPPGDERALACALRRVLNDQPRERAGAAGLRREVQEAYCWDRATDALEEVYARVTGRRPPLPRRTTAADRERL